MLGSTQISPLKKQRNIRNNSTTLYTIKRRGSATRRNFKTPHKKSSQIQDTQYHDSSRPNKNVPKNKMDLMTLQAVKSTLLKNIPKTVQYHQEQNRFIEICFSYIDQGLQKWKIGKIIGRGNSSVREAMNIKNGVRAAVKQVILNTNDQAQKLKEIKILQKLSHNNIVKYYEHYKIKSQTWIFMEFVEINLRKFYLNYGIPPVDVILAFAKQILEALCYLKKQKVIHKDIKCENILLDNGVIKLCDFGCSKDFRNTISLKLYEKNPPAKSPKGSYLWAAPQCHRDAKFSFESDMWSFGCTLCELIRAELPWSEVSFQNEIQVMKYIADGSSIPKIEQSWDLRLKQILGECLKREPGQRITAQNLLLREHLWK